MNEQIEKLVGKAWEEADKEVSEKDWHTWVHDGIFQAKLVELVVKECITIANTEHKMALEFEWDNDDTAQTIKDSIKKHFGV
jgi:hypothetical protein